MTRRRHRAALAVAAVSVLGLAVWLTPARASGGAGHASTVAVSATTPLPRPSYVPKIRHVFVINIENKGYDETFGAGSASPYLAGKLRRMGVLLNSYYATAHNSLPNYLAQISGQAPTVAGQLDCQLYSPFTATGPDQDPGQKVGTGCVYPDDVDTLPMQLTRSGLTWRGYMQQMNRPCQHPALGTVDPTQHASPGHNYAVRHNPFMYFRAITARKQFCKSHVRLLAGLTHDLAHVGTTRNLTYISPDLCRDGHDDPCAGGAKGGLPRVDEFLKRWAPRILASPAFQRNGMLVITADESDSPVEDSTSCCDEAPGPNVLKPGIIGAGGGKVGALVISHFTRKNTWSTTPYNHYSLLASLEEIFGQPKLGMAGQTGLPVFGLDVYNNGWWNR